MNESDASTSASRSKHKKTGEKFDPCSCVCFQCTYACVEAVFTVKYACACACACAGLRR